jgi:hypothetical protein
MTTAAPDHATAHLHAGAARARWVRQILRVSVSRLVISISLALLGIIGYPGPGAVLCMVLAALTVIIGGVWLDALERRARIAARLLAYHASGLQRLAGHWGRATDTGVPEAGPAHPYAHDLSVVGERSLFTLIDTSASRTGRALLLRYLLDEEGHPDAGQEQDVRWLARQHAWRADFHAAGLEARLQADDHLAAWIDAGAGPPGALRWAMRIVRVLFLAGIATAAVTWDATGTVLIALALVPISVPIDMLALRWLQTLGDRDALALTIAHERRLMQQLALLPTGSDAPASLAALARLAQEGESALGALQSVCETLAQRRNPIWAYLIGAVLLSEWRNLDRLELWSQRYAESRERWLLALARIDALSCLATYVAEQGGCWPTWTEDGPVFAARALSHPLLPPGKRVGNSIAIDAHGVLVVTGANASGKSTFLRASLLSVVLARCGVTVPAEDLRLRRMRLATVMAVQDDVVRGISRFQAEVGRLKQVLDLTGSRGLPVLVALDEPLSGTNSVERHLGTVAVARALAERAAAVLISTHDLGLADLAQEADLGVQVVHFSDHAAEGGGSGTLAFDYVMRPGVLQTTNALRIMRLAGLPVPEAGRVAPPSASDGREGAAPAH